MKKHQTQDNSPRIQQAEKIKFDLNIREFPWTEKQKKIIDTVLDKDTNIVFLAGPAGTSKSLLATYCGLKLLASKRVSNILYVRSVVESASKSMGYLPGVQEDKFGPYLMPLQDKIDELLYNGQGAKLFNDDKIIATPVNFLRGASLRAQYIWGEEMQNMVFSEILTIISRLGQKSKMILTGDFGQSDINSKSGFKRMFDLFNDDESRKNGIHCFEFDKSDIKRHEILKFILEKVELDIQKNPKVH